MTASSKINNSPKINILIIRLSAIGDIFHTFTALSDIKKQIPSVSIDWLVDEQFQDIAQSSPLIDNLITIPIKRWRKNSHFWFLNLLQWKTQFDNQYNNKHYDYVIDMHGLIKTAIMTKMFNGESYGLNYKSAKEGLWASIFYKHTFSVNKNQVAIKRFRSLVGQILNINYLEPFNFQIKVEETNHSSDNYILLLHGTSKDRKKWSIENWTNLSVDLLSNLDHKIYISYSNPTEEQFVNTLHQNLISLSKNSDNIQLKNFIILKKLPIAQFCSIVQNAKLVIGVDTGFTHLANLLHRPTIGIYLISNQHYAGLLSDKISYNLVCDNSKNEHRLITAMIETHRLL